MKICSVVTLASASSRYGGPFDIAREQVRLLTGAGHEVEFVAGYVSGDRAPDLPSGTSAFRRIRRWLPTRDFTAMLSFGMLRQLWVSVGRADVVHVSFAREAVPVAAVLVALLRRRAVVAQPHGMLTIRRSRALDAIDTVLRPLLRRVDAWIALTPLEARSLRARFPGLLRAVTAVGNPIPLEAAEVERLLAEFPDPEPSAVFVARLHPRKRVLDFAAAAAVAERNGWGDRYRVFGPDQGDLPTLLERAERLNDLSYEGALDATEIPAFLARSGVFVLPSQDEPWGNVLATAVTLGVPSVITRSSALAEMLDDMNGVRIVADGDAEAIAHAVHDALAAGHVPPSSRFDRATVRDALLEVYRSVAPEAAR